MNKKLLGAALVAGAVLAAFGMTACGSGGKHTHSISSEWSYDEYYHYHEADCGSVNHREDVGEHTGSKCFCGYGSSEQGGSDEGALGAALDGSGVLTFSPVANAVKYVLEITFAGESVSFDIDKSQSSVDLEALTGCFPSGKTTVKLSAWELYTEKIEGETIEQEIPMDGYSETFRVVKLNGKFSLVRLSYSDEFVVLDGFVKETTDGGARYVYELALKDNKPTRFNVSTYAKAASGKSIKFYKTAEGRNVGNQADEYSSFELPMLSMNHGENKFYARVTGETTADYDLCVYGLYELGVSRMSVAYTGSGIREFTYTDLGSISVTERDIIAQSILYAGVGSGNIGRTSGYEVIERGDYIIEAGASAAVTLYFYGENDVRADCAEFASYSESFSVADNGSVMTLYAKQSAGDTVVVPYAIAGTAVGIANFNYSDVKTVAIAEGTKYYNLNFTDCNAVTDVYLPSTITDMDNYAIKGVPRTTTVHCAFSRETAQGFSSNWNGISGQYNKYFATVYDDAFSGGGGTSVKGLDIRGGVVYGVTDEFDGVIPDATMENGSLQNVTQIQSIHADGEPYLGKIVIGKNVSYIAPDAFKYRVASVEVKEGNGAFYTENGVLYNKRSHVPVLSSAEAEYCGVPSAQYVQSTTGGLAVYPAAYTRYNAEFPKIKVYVADDRLPGIEFGDGCTVEYGIERLKSGNNVYLLDKAHGTAVILKYGSDDTWIRGFEYIYTGSGADYKKYVITDAMPGSISCPNVTRLDISASFISAFFDAYAGELPRGLEEVQISEAYDLTDDGLSRLKAFNAIKRIELSNFDDEYNPVENDRWECKDNVVYKLDGDDKSVAFVAPAVESVSIDEGVATIPAGAFRGGKFIYISLPDSLTEIGEDAFRDCKGLSSITIPEGCTVRTRAFYGCTKLASVTFWGYCETEEDAFKHCGKLNEILVWGKKSDYDKHIKYTSDGKPAFDGMFRCLAGSYVRYVKSTGEVKDWSIEILYT